MDLTIFYDQKIKSRPKDFAGLQKLIVLLEDRQVKVNRVNELLKGDGGLLWNLAGSDYLPRIMGWKVVNFAIPHGIDIVKKGIVVVDNPTMAIKLGEKVDLDGFSPAGSGVITILGNEKVLSLAEDWIIRHNLISRTKLLPYQDVVADYFVDLAGDDGQYPDFWEMTARGSVCCVDFPTLNDCLLDKFTAQKLLGENQKKAEEFLWEQVAKRFISQLFLVDKE